MVDRSLRKTPRTTQHSEESRQRILDATIEIAAERGYDGTSITLVSDRSGLPVGSIYWHFGNKDGLLAAVIERSYQRWRQTAGAVPPPAPGWHPPRLSQVLTSTLSDDPEFLRLGLMLALERRQVEPTAREAFLRFRGESFDGLVEVFRVALADRTPPVQDAVCRNLAQLTVAVADGLFLAHQVSPDTLDVGVVVDTYVRALGLLLADQPGRGQGPS